MVDFIQLQNVMREHLDQDRKIKLVTVKGPTLEAVIADAAILLEVSVRHLDYEVAERGSPGVFGSGKKDWVINAYGRRSKVAVGTEYTEDIETEDAAPVIQDKDGDVFLQLRPEGALLKAIAPMGNGKEATEYDAMHLVRARDVTDVDEDIVSSVLQEAAGEYTRIGDFERHIANDSWVKVEISEDEMQAFVTVTPPGLGGCDISFDGYMEFLEKNRVVHGINEEFLHEFADRPIYNERVKVAQGSDPQDGRDAYVQYNFDVEKSRKFKEGSNGRVDFKELNIIKNVVENQPLAKMIPPEKGIPGRTVKGMSISAKSGKERPLPLGNNVHVDDDGATIISDINGQVIITNEKINVEPIYIVDGNVDLKTGNIIFLGTVIIKGNVEDGFSVKAAGNIEINGTVERAELDAEGEIIVHQGITGKNEGIVKAGGAIYARFIENSRIDSGNWVVVSDGIINSQVDACKGIVCHGKRAHIVGGRLRALEEINAKIIGSPTSGTETICEVGVDPKSKSRLEFLLQTKSQTEAELGELTRNLQTLINIKRQRKVLPEDKEATMHELMEKRNNIIGDLQSANEEIVKVQEYLNNLDVRGKVSASSKVYPGVQVLVRDVKYDVHTEYKAVTFILEDGLVRFSKYEELSDDVKLIPDGFTTD